MAVANDNISAPDIDVEFHLYEHGQVWVILINASGETPISTGTSF